MKENDTNYIRGNLAISGFGFESKTSLVNALRIDEAKLDTAIELCETSDPYERWYERKRSGGQRLIEHPIPSLKLVQRRLNRLLQRLRLPGVFHGSYSCTSILSNAKPHCKVSWYLTFDLANYYKTIRPQKVYVGLRFLQAPPDIARLITRLTTVHGRVPQGAPTSPMIAAIAMLSLARRLMSLCSKMGAAATIYGDNICISGNAAIKGHKSTFLRIVKTEGFRIRASKTQLVPPNEDKPLPGLIVRKGHATVCDDDLANITRIVERCVALGETGLANRVCHRYPQHLRGVVNHYAWIDSDAMSEAANLFAQIDWPEKHNRHQCLSPKCYCDVV